MNLSEPWLVLEQPTDLALLRVLVRVTRSLSGRELGRLASMPNTTASRRLNTLAQQGLVKVQEAPPALLYTFNREHVLAEPVESLFRAHEELEQRLRREVASWQVAPFHVSLFGSAARRDGGPTSDIDIFIIRPASVSQDDAVWRAQLGRLGELILAWTGNRLGLSEVPQGQLRRLTRERPPVVRDLLRDAVTVAGPMPSVLFARAST